MALRLVFCSLLRGSECMCTSECTQGVVTWNSVGLFICKALTHPLPVYWNSCKWWYETPEQNSSGVKALSHKTDL